MTKNIIYLLATLIIILPSCSKEWLDKKPNKNLTSIETIEDCEGLLDNEILNRSAPLVIGEVGADGHYILESRWQGSMTDIERNAYTWDNERLYLDLNEWNHPYEQILYCNLALEGLRKFTPRNREEQDTYNRTMGNALFQRARSTYELAQVYAPAYNTSTADSDLGIPLRLESDINIPSVRSSIAQTYGQVIDDLQKATNLLPNVPVYKTRGSKAAVFALFSRVYMSMRNYEMAGKCADSCLKYYDNLMDYNTLSQTATVIGQMNDEVIFHSQGFNRSSITTNGFIDPNIYSSYTDNDLRKVIFYRVNANTTIAFKGNYNNSNVRPFFGLATDEVYLTKAECLARAGMKDNAMDILNRFLKTRWRLDSDSQSTYIDMTALNADEALDIILREREKSLILRGTRWMDLRRLSFDPGRGGTITRTIGGNTYTLEPQSYKYTFPIPDDVIQQSGMPQNVGWEK